MFWAAVPSNRQEYLGELIRLRQGYPCVPIIIRDASFDAPNALMSDLVELISNHRDAFNYFADPTTIPKDRVVVLLLSRTEFALPQVASPAVLPHWFPIDGGRTVDVVIDDLTKSAEVPYNAEEANTEALCEGLFELEGVLLARLRKVHQDDRRLTNAFLDSIRLKDETRGFVEILDEAEGFRGTIGSPTGFRPSAREARSLVGRFLRIVSASSADALTGHSRALGGALSAGGVEAPSWCALVVLSRSATPDGTVEGKLGRGVLLTSYYVSQLVTTAAHADQYPKVNLSLLRAVSHDLRKSLDDLITYCRQLP